MVQSMIRAVKGAGRANGRPLWWVIWFVCAPVSVSEVGAFFVMWLKYEALGQRRWPTGAQDACRGAGKNRQRAPAQGLGAGSERMCPRIPVQLVLRSLTEQAFQPDAEGISGCTLFMCKASSVGNARLTASTARPLGCRSLPCRGRLFAVRWAPIALCRSAPAAALYSRISALISSASRARAPKGGPRGDG